MTLSDLVSALNKKHNGSFIKIIYSGDLPLNATSRKNEITAKKIVEMTVRKGISYKNQKSVQEKVSNGKELTHELPFGSWKEGYEGLIIEHNGHDYVRLYSSPNSRKTSYFINEKEVSYDELKESNCLVNSFFKPKTERPDCLTVKVENILEVL